MWTLVLAALTVATAAEPSDAAEGPERAIAEAHDDGLAEHHGDGPADHHGEGEHGHERKLMLGFKAWEVGALGAESSGAHAGGGVFGTAVVVPGWLELEFNAREQPAEEGLAVPLTLLALKPFHLSSLVHPFVGVGPEILVAPKGPAEPGMATYWGAEGVAGTMLWPSEHVGVVAEATFGLVGEEGLIEEVGAAAGLVVGF